MEISEKQFEIEAWYQLPTNRKWRIKWWGYRWRHETL